MDERMIELKGRMKRVLSLVMAFAMVLSLAPMPTFAADTQAVTGSTPPNSNKTLDITADDNANKRDKSITICKGQSFTLNVDGFTSSGIGYPTYSLTYRDTNTDVGNTYISFQVTKNEPRNKKLTATITGLKATNGTIVKLRFLNDGWANYHNDITITVVDHDFQHYNQTKTPTCTEKGEETASCENKCGATQTREVDELGHEFLPERYAHSKDATCIDLEEVTAKCSRCSETDTKTVEGTLTAHEPAAAGKENVVAKDCETDGEWDEVVYCSVCNEELSSEHKTDAAPGHDWDEGVTTKVATCAEAGVKTFTCGTCGGTRTEEINALPHTWDGGRVTTPATCQAPGVKTFTCTVCSGTRTEELPIDENAHVWKEGFVTITEANCENDGEIRAKCEFHEEVGETTVVPALGHDYVESSRTAATCDEDGEIVYVCTRDESHTYTQTIAALGHSYTAAVTQTPTCSVPGVRTFTCGTCGDEYTEEIPTIAHTWDAGTVTKAANCQETGNRRYSCTVCQKATRNEPIPVNPNNHVGTEIRGYVPATCEDEGATGATYCTNVNCPKNDDENPLRESFPVAVKGHDYVLKSSNETKHTFECQNDKTHTYDENHDWGTPVSVGNTTTTTCQVCGFSIVDSGVTASTSNPIFYVNLCKGQKADLKVWSESNTNRDAGVTIGSGGYAEVTSNGTALGTTARLTATGYPVHIEAKSAGTMDVKFSYTATASGIAGVVSGRATFTATIHITVKNHTIGTYHEQVAPTCTENGVSLATCSNDIVYGLSDDNVLRKCGEPFEGVLDALGHTEVEDDNYVAPTCTETGLSASKTCSRCHEVSTPQMVIPALGHTEVDIPAIPATCEKSGWTAGKECTVCGTVTVNPVIAQALGHDYKYVDTPATCEQDGIRTYTCANDASHTYTQTLTALGHKYILSETVSATCEKGEYNYYVCDNDKSHTKEEPTGVPALGHDWSEWIQIDDNEHRKTCYNDANHTETKAHSWDNGVNEDGLITYTCSDCDGHKYEIDPNAEIKSIVEGSIRATSANAVPNINVTLCKGQQVTINVTTDGGSSGSVTNLSSNAYVTRIGSGNLSATGTLVLRALAATRTNSPVTITVNYQTGSIFNRTNYKATITVTVVDHTGEDWDIQQDPTCIAAGTKKGICKATNSCGENTHSCGAIVIETIKATGVHTPEKVDGKAPTCSATGLTEGEKCSVCGTITVAQETINTIPHTPGEETEDTSVHVDATCVATGHGEYVKNCTVCGSETARRSVTVDALGHSFVNFVSNGDATCTANGTETAKCERCDEMSTRTEDNSMTGHTEVSSENAVAPTCTVEGKESDTKCAVCGVKLSDGAVISATGHHGAEPVEVNRKNATCLKDGSYDKVTYCKDCREELDRETIILPASNSEHVYGKVPTWTWVKSGSDWKASYTYACTKCGDPSKPVNATVTKGETVDNADSKTSTTTYYAESKEGMTDSHDVVTPMTVYKITVDGVESNYKYGQFVKLNAPEKDGMKFEAWYEVKKDGTQRKASTYFDYSFHVTRDIELISKYVEVEKPVEEEPIVDLVLEKIASGKVDVTLTWSLPQSFKVSEIGILRGTSVYEDIVSESVMKAKGTKSVSSQTSRNGVYVLHLSGIGVNKFVNAMGYVKYFDANGQEQTIYTGVFNISAK